MAWGGDKRWLRFNAAYSANIAGDRIVDLAIPVISLTATGGVEYSGIFILFSSVPRFIVGPGAPGIMARFPTLAWCSLGNVIQSAAALMILCAVSDWGHTGVLVALAGVLSGVGGGVFGIAMMPSIKNIVPSSSLAKASSHLEVIDSALTMLVPLIVGMIVDDHGIQGVLFAAFALHAASAVLRFDVPLSPRDAEGRERFLGQGNAVFRLTGMISTVRLPFLGRGRALVSLIAVSVAALSQLAVPVMSLQISQAGGGATQIGLAFTAAGFLGLFVAGLAGRARAAAGSITLTFSILVTALALLVMIAFLPSVATLILVYALVDGLTAWIYVAVPYHRLAMEGASDLTFISGGQMFWGSLMGGLLGLGVAQFGTPEGIGGFTATVCAVGVLILSAVFSLGGANSVRAGMKKSLQEG